MNENKIEELIEKLIIRTQNKKAIWNQTSRDTEYSLNFEKGSITTDSWNDVGIDSVDFTIRNDKGLVIHTESHNYKDNPEKYNLILKLHSVVKASYYNIEDTIDDFFKELGSDKTIGKSETDLPF